MVLLLVLAGVGFGQPGAVVGSVADGQTGEPVEYANVVLYRAADSVQVTGGVSGPDGSFALGPLPPGSYYVELSFIGFRSRKVADVEVAAGGRVDLGRLVLDPTVLPVEGTEVVGERPAFTYEVDKKVIEVSKLPAAQSGTAVDALENAPSVTVDIEGNVSLRGSRNFTLLVDGRPTVLEPSDALRQIPAPTIDKIEIITNPSAKFDPDGVAGVINVLLKKERMLGLSSLANLNAGNWNRYGGNLLLGYRQGMVNAHLGGDLMRRPWHSDRTYDRSTWRAGETLYVSGKGPSDWDPVFGGGRAGVELAFGPRDVASLSGRLGAYESENEQLIEVTERYEPGDSSRTYTNGGGMGWQGRYLYLLADHQHSFDTIEHKLVARVSYADSRNESRSGSVVLGADGDTTSGRRVVEAGPMRSGRAELEYKLPLREKDEFEAGYQGRLEQADQQYDLYWFQAGSGFVLDQENSHPYFGARYIHSVFGTYAWNWQKLGAKLGLRVEHGQRVVDVSDLEQRYEVNRWDYFPSAHLSYGLPAGQVMASYSRRIQRPWPWLLRPFPTWSDERNVMQGNPELLPEYTDSYEAGYQLPFGTNMVSVQGFYRASVDPFEWVESVDSTLPGVLRMVAANVGTQQSLGGELAVNYSLFPWWNINLSGNVYQYRAEGELNDSAFSRESFNWDGRLSFDFRMPTGTRLTVNGYYDSPSVSTQGSNQGYFVTDFAVQQLLLNRALAIVLRVRDPFGTAGWTAESEGLGFKSAAEYRHMAPVVSLSVRYNFNNFRFDPKMREGDEMPMQGGGPQM